MSYFNLLSATLQLETWEIQSLTATEAWSFPKGKEIASNLLSNIVNLSFQSILSNDKTSTKIMNKLHRISSSCLKVKFLPKCDLGTFCECTRVKCSFKTIITMKAPLLRLTVFSFEGQNHFQWSAGANTMLALKLLFLKH